MRAILAALSLLLVPAPGRADDWTGQRVVMKRAGVILSRFGPDDKSVPCGEVREASVTVLADTNGWLRVRQRGTDGWFPKSEALLVRDAVDHFTVRIGADLADADPRFRRAVAWSERGELDKAVVDLDEAIRLKPGSPGLHNYRGMVHKLRADYDRAVADFTEAIRLDPRLVPAYYNRGILWRAKREPRRAIADYTEAVRLDPGFGVAFNNRGLAWKDLGEYEKAAADFTEAVRLDPDDFGPRYNRGLCHNLTRNYDQALVDYAEAIRLNPTLAVAYFDRAVIRANCPTPKYRDPALAVEDARRACELTDWKNPQYLSTLAWVSADAGRFEEAVKWQKAALADPAFERRFGQSGRDALRCYEQKQPYRSAGE